MRKSSPFLLCAAACTLFITPASADDNAVIRIYQKLRGDGGIAARLIQNASGTFKRRLQAIKDSNYSDDKSADIIAIMTKDFPAEEAEMAADAKSRLGRPEPAVQDWECTKNTSYNAANGYQFDCTANVGDAQTPVNVTYSVFFNRDGVYTRHVKGADNRLNCAAIKNQQTRFVPALSEFIGQILGCPANLRKDADIIRTELNAILQADEKPEFADGGDLNCAGEVTQVDLSAAKKAADDNAASLEFLKGLRTSNPEKFGCQARTYRHPDCPDNLENGIKKTFCEKLNGLTDNKWFRLSIECEEAEISSTCKVEDSETEEGYGCTVLRVGGNSTTRCGPYLIGSRAQAELDALCAGKANGVQDLGAEKNPRYIVCADNRYAREANLDDKKAFACKDEQDFKAIWFDLYHVVCRNKEFLRDFDDDKDNACKDVPMTGKVSHNGAVLVCANGLWYHDASDYEACDYYLIELNQDRANLEKKNQAEAACRNEPDTLLSIRFVYCDGLVQRYKNDKTAANKDAAEAACQGIQGKLDELEAAYQEQQQRMQALRENSEGLDAAYRQNLENNRQSQEACEEGARRTVSTATGNTGDTFAPVSREEICRDGAWVPFEAQSSQSPDDLDPDMRPAGGYAPNEGDDLTAEQRELKTSAENALQRQDTGKTWSCRPETIVSAAGNRRTIQCGDNGTKTYTVTLGPNRQAETISPAMDPSGAGSGFWVENTREQLISKRGAGWNCREDNTVFEIRTSFISVECTDANGRAYNVSSSTWPGNERFVVTPK